MRELWERFKLWWGFKTTGTKIGIVVASLSVVLIAVLVPVFVLTSSTTTDKNLTLWVPFNPSGTQGKALNSIVESYNANNEDDYDVDVIWVDGYQAVIDNLSQFISAGKELPELYIGYVDATAVLFDNRLVSEGIDYGTLALDFSTTDASSPLYVENFVQPLLNQQKNAVGYEDGGLYTIPIVNSSELTSINAPAFTYLLNQFLTLGGTVNFEAGNNYEILRKTLDAVDGSKDGYVGDPTNGLLIHDLYGSITGDTVFPLADADEIQAIVATAAEQISADDLVTIKAGWDQYTLLPSVTGSITLGDWAFQDVTSFYDIGENLISPFTNFGPSSTQSIIGIDSVANAYYTYTQTYGGSYVNPKNSVTFLDDNGTPEDKSDDFINYSIIDKVLNDNADPLDNTQGYSSGVLVYDQIKKGVESGIYWVPTQENPYGSNNLKQHKQIFSTGSTTGAGYHYSDIPGELNLDEIIYINSPSTLGEQAILDVNGDIIDQTPINTQATWEASDKVYQQQGPGMGAINKGDYYSQQQTVTFLEWLVSDQKQDYVIDDVTYVDQTPTEFLTTQSGYIAGTTSVITGDNPDSEFEEMIKYNNQSSGSWVNEIFVPGQAGVDALGNPVQTDAKLIGPTIAYEQLERGSSGGLDHLTLEATGPNTGSFRAYIDNQLKTLKTTIQTGGINPTATEFIFTNEDSLYTTAVINGWIVVSQDIWEGGYIALNSVDLRKDKE